MSDTALVARIRDGDEEALDTIIRRYQAHIYRFGMKMCRNPEDAEDVVQDTLLAAARTINGFRGASSVSTWLYSIARSFCIKKRRKSKFAPAREESLEREASGEARELADPSRSPEEQAEARQLEDALESAISTLDDKYREILILRDVEGLTAPQVAEVTGISVAAVKSRLHRARGALRDHLAPILERDDPRAPPTTPQCSDIIRTFSQHLEGEISSDLCAKMQEHVDGCPHCKVTCDSLNRVLSACHMSPTPEVPERIQTAVRLAIQNLGST